MADHSKIEWTEATWSAVTGCTKVSSGCLHCYIETTTPFRMEHRRFDKGAQIGATTGVRLHPERLPQPLKWKRPRRIFVCSLADLFQDAVPDEFIAQVFAVMALAPQHTFQCLTKRHARMRSLLNSREWWVEQVGPAYERMSPSSGARALTELRWPWPHVWMGVSVEDQQWADIRIPALLDTPAAVRWISAEPLLGPIDLDRARCDAHDRDEVVVDDDGRESCGYCSADGFSGELSYGHWLDPLNSGIAWVVVGGESGRGARPMSPDWARQLRDQCAAAGVPFLFKQAGSVLAREWGGTGKGGDPAHWPEAFPREYPEVRR